MSTNTAALKAKISKLGKDAFEKKMASGKFSAEELPIALEIQKQRQAKAQAQPAPKIHITVPKVKADKTTPKEKTPPASKTKAADKAPKEKKAPVKKVKDAVDTESKNYGKSEFVRTKIAEGVRSHKEIAALVLEKFATRLYYSEYDRCRKQVDQRPVDKK